MLLLFPGCASAPPTLSPQGAAAFQATRVVHALDLFRDTAIAAEAQTPPVLSRATARRVVSFHRAVLTLLRQVPNGWVATVSDGLVSLAADLPAADQPALLPYIRLIQTLLVEVPR